MITAAQLVPPRRSGFVADHSALPSPLCRSPYFEPLLQMVAFVFWGMCRACEQNKS